jgi:hypothetical protein
MTSCASRSACTARAEPARARAARACLVALTAGLTTAACSQPRDAQPYEGACEPLRVLAFNPLAGAQAVPRDTTISARFDDYPDPNTLGDAGDASLLITTGVFYFPGVYAVDLIDKTISFRNPNGLRADLGFNINVRASLASLQGCAAVPEQRSFHTATAAPPALAPVVQTPYATVQKIFAGRCAGAACHRADAADAGGCLPEPAAGLSLCDAEAVDALLDVPSRQRADLHLVEPNDSSRSYLLRKLLPGATPDVPAPTTLGHRDPPGAPLTDDELHAVASWIDTGPAR